MDTQRLVLTDGWNSFWHVAFGMSRSQSIAAVFVVYQLYDTDVNTAVDILEFALGWLLAAVLHCVPSVPSSLIRT